MKFSLMLILLFSICMNLTAENKKGDFLIGRNIEFNNKKSSVEQIESGKTSNHESKLNSFPLNLTVGIGNIEIKSDLYLKTNIIQTEVFLSQPFLFSQSNRTSDSMNFAEICNILVKQNLEYDNNNCEDFENIDIQNDIDLESVLI